MHFKIIWSMTIRKTGDLLRTIKGCAIVMPLGGGRRPTRQHLPMSLHEMPWQSEIASGCALAMTHRRPRNDKQYTSKDI